MRPTYDYTISTQHGDENEGAFVVPVSYVAVSPFEAAKARFAAQSPSSRRGTTALLVSDGHYSYVFPVVSSAPIVAPSHSFPGV